MECTFVVGQKVKCVRGMSSFPGQEKVLRPEVGDIGTIREVYSCRDGIGVRLLEIRNKPCLTFGGIAEIGFPYQAFRPVTDLLAEFMAKRKRRRLTTLTVAELNAVRETTQC